MILSDNAIRNSLVSFLNNRTPKPTATIEELRIHNGNAIADVVAVYESAHCFEIKGENDTLNRIQRQAEFYNTTFPKITLVTTTNHVLSAKKIIPDFWGILIAKNIGNKITFSYIRKAKRNIHINKYLALSMLWKSELMNIATDIDNSGLNKKITRSQLANFITKNKSKGGIVNDITSTILNRYKTEEIS